MIFGFSSIYIIIHNKIVLKLFYLVEENYILKPQPVILFIIFALIWLGLITGTYSAVLSTIDKTSANITNFGQHTLNTSLFDQLFSSSSENPQALLTQEINDASKEYSHNNFIFYPKSTYKNYLPTIINNDTLPSRVPIVINNIVDDINYFIVKIMKVLIILGFIGTIVLFRKKLFTIEYYIISVALALALVFITSIPAISLYYPIGRLDQQALFLIALPTILSSSWLLQFIPNRIRMIFIALLFITYFFSQLHLFPN